MSSASIRRTDPAALLRPITARERFGPETFRDTCFRWDVSKANRMFDAGILAGPEPLDVEGAYQYIAFGEINFTPHATRQIDLGRPCLRIDLGDAGVYLIDGWNRVHDAHEKQIDQIPVIYLTHDQERAIRIGAWKNSGIPWHGIDDAIAEAELRRIPCPNCHRTIDPDLVDRHVAWAHAPRLEQKPSIRL